MATAPGRSDPCARPLRAEEMLALARAIVRPGGEALPINRDSSGGEGGRAGAGGDDARGLANRARCETGNPGTRDTREMGKLRHRSPGGIRPTAGGATTPKSAGALNLTLADRKRQSPIFIRLVIYRKPPHVACARPEG